MGVSWYRDSSINPAINPLFEALSPFYFPKRLSPPRPVFSLPLTGGKLLPTRQGQTKAPAKRLGLQKGGLPDGWQLEKRFDVHRR